MTHISPSFMTGDWIVHRHYGVGQIMGVEVKRIGERENTYFRIKSYDSTFWVPIDAADEDWLRPVASAAELKRALSILRSEPTRMESNLSKRKHRINKVEPNDTPSKMATLLRDLWAYKMDKKNLSMSEEKLLRRFTDGFIYEWAVIMKIAVDEARQRFDDIRDQQREALMS